jgi:chemotaxis signal transduction protein
MTTIPGSAEARLADLRRDFDQVFAAPAAGQAQDEENLIAFRVGDDLYGLSVREITGVAVAGRLVALPSRSPGLVGLAGIRGAVIPVYSLAVILGYPKAGETVRWLALSGEKEPLALALGDFEGYLRVPTSDLHVPDRASRTHVHQFARTGGVVRAIVSVASVMSSIQGTKGSEGPSIHHPSG